MLLPEEMAGMVGAVEEAVVLVTELVVAEVAAPEGASVAMAVVSILMDYPVISQESGSEPVEVLV
jgi:hypothetical protein